ncbi:uncharacterized protein B0T23DRAFT_402013 [Neurospora hispaniola]|uniref:Uncharacterized protein n=1 Tax=Neurospora hispaniola TaxID=588809 RepID=A0AAJ0IBQ7_9PEZI|nr:hypothetical protein B0T23DRAFT_402013 [Neurospora hispaniola]
MEHTFNHQKWDPIRKAYPAYWKLWKDTLLDRMDFDMPPPPPLSPGSDDSSPSPPRPPRSPRERPPTPVDPYGAERSYLRVPATAFFWSSPSLPCSPRSNELDKADHSKGQAAASPRSVTVLPMQDLIIIRPSSWTPHIHEGYWQALEHGFPFGAKKYGFPGFCGWKGFAIEYDPSWGERQTWGATWRDDSIWLDDGSFKLPDGTVGVMDSIYKAVSNFEQIQTIWLIDYRLKAKQNTPAAIRRLDSSQKVFYGGDGCQFVEVYREFVESGGGYLNEYYTEGIDGENSAMSQGSCHWFIEEFEVRMFGDLYDSDESVDSNYSRYPPHIGLLACLP